ncbi:Riboflavin kinase-like protein [Hapsidospora chrysogenum ATCC 11550]|uniref:Riboflavin kinase n=1 Tax=Hapsidospora chrysogenum (strain ATCC 11550 / CBS 779.69 / DSM 880 / IAM 14645 / JCM 23072 / IMI 49137) TaxID=857340 RepID=A0A086SVA5_HAPC1|nr:Riboflavin kinase-like protein [Hapsidospora chrysogenum ATCC 11550]
MDPQFRRRPVPAPSGRVAPDAHLFPDPSLLAPDRSATLPPPPLRYARSATNLRAAHDRPATAVADPRGHLPVDFVVDTLPTPSQSLSASPSSTGELRRAKSSSALSSLSASLDPRPSSSSSTTTHTANSNPSKAEASAASRWKHALGEAQYFAGGLLSRPAESTRHYTIIRHSHALVWYRGPSTSVSITILSDIDLPPTRTLWLQQKGYSGNVGMSLKALVGTTGTWLDVTPATRAPSPEDVGPGVLDERAIQRDLKRFSKKASGRQKGHSPRETHVVRIPAAATDGYFRLVLCAGGSEGGKGRKVLCGCPVFRVASTSTDISVVRGASIRTMPLEVGVKVGTTVAQQFAKKYTAPAALVVQNRATKVATKALTNPRVKQAATAGKTIVKTSGLDQAVVGSWRKGQVDRYGQVAFDNTVRIIGSDEGPEAPFPVSFEGKTARATGRSTVELGVPTANLSGVRDEIKMRWKGVYAAWASIVPDKKSPVADGGRLSHDWHEAIVTVGPLRYGPPEVVVKNRVAVHFLYDFDEATFFDMRVRVLLMGYLHPPPESCADPDDLFEQYVVDSMSVTESLAREAWSVSSCLRSKSFSERLDGVTGAVQGKVDKIPLHWAGVRSESAAMRDKVYGNGGIWIQR